MGVSLRFSPLEWNLDNPGLDTGCVDAGDKPRMLIFGAQVTRAAVRTEVTDAVGIGSVYFSTGGEMYIKVADNGAAADWEVIGHSAADTG